MELVLFKITGKIKAINQKKIKKGQWIKSPSCFPDYPPPYEIGTKYQEIILEECQISPDFGDKSSSEKVRLVFFGKKFPQKEFVIGQEYTFNCTGSSNFFWPLHWKKN